MALDVTTIAPHFGVYSTVHKIEPVVQFTVSEKGLNRPNLYPRQATLLKVIFLDLESMTDYDYQVIAEWEQKWADTADVHGEGTEGISPGVLERIKINRMCPCGHDRGLHGTDEDMSCLEDGCGCRDYRGRRWFRDLVVVIGRRGGKGYIGAIAFAYILWHFINLGDPKGYYGIDRSKQLAGLVFAGKKEQARAHQWSDINNVLLDAPAFSAYIHKGLGESMTVRSRNDSLRDKEREDRGVRTTADTSAFTIEPKEASLMAARGPASFAIYIDEAAHIVRGVSKFDAQEIWDCLEPSTPILHADLVWRPIGDVSVGDVLVGVDEEPLAEGTTRKIRRSEVLAVRRSVSQPYRITFDDGSYVVCSDRHRWARIDDQGLRWSSISVNKVAGNKCVRCSGSRLRKNGHKVRGGVSHQMFKCVECNIHFGVPEGEVLPDVIGRVGNPRGLRPGDRIQWIVDPWELDESREAGYIAGMFDGEGTVNGSKGGSLLNRGWLLPFTQLPGVVLDRTEHAIRDRGYAYSLVTPKENGVSGILVRGMRDVFRFLGEIRPERYMLGSHVFWEDRTPSHRGQPNSKTIVSIEPDGNPRELVDITTSTGTFVANGMLSHNSAAPSLAQFGRDGFSYMASSPWQKIGLFRERYVQSFETNPDGSAAFPERLMIHLPSWAMYDDWDIAHTIPMWPGGPTFPTFRGPVIAYDDERKQIERANPETFRVEYKAGWAAVLDAYLNPHSVAKLWEPIGDDEPLQIQQRGSLHTDYWMHGDPSKSGARFGLVVGHAVHMPDSEIPHVIIDLIHHWEPGEFEGHEVDYEIVVDQIAGWMDGFMPTNVTFDQFSSVALTQPLQRHALSKRYPKRVEIYERTATAPLNWATYETFKTALNLGLVHAPYYEELNQELLFLQANGQRIDHPTSGPVQTKDIADAISIVVYELIGGAVAQFTGLSSLQVRGGMPGGSNPYSAVREQGVASEVHEALSALGRGKRYQPPRSRGGRG